MAMGSKVRDALLPIYLPLNHMKTYRLLSVALLMAVFVYPTIVSGQESWFSSLITKIDPALSLRIGAGKTIPMGNAGQTDGWGWYNKAGGIVKPFQASIWNTQFMVGLRFMNYAKYGFLANFCLERLSFNYGLTDIRKLEYTPFISGVAYNTIFMRRYSLDLALTRNIELGKYGRMIIDAGARISTWKFHGDGFRFFGSATTPFEYQYFFSLGGDFGTINLEPVVSIAYTIPSTRRLTVELFSNASFKLLSRANMTSIHVLDSSDPLYFKTLQQSFQPRFMFLTGGIGLVWQRRSAAR
jgi:hypothetical protein